MGRPCSEQAPQRGWGGCTWEGGERAGVGGGAVSHARHQAEAEDLLQEPPAAAAPAAARLTALHPLTGPASAAAIGRLLFRPPPSARLSQWKVSRGDRQAFPPTAARQGASGQPGPVPTPALPWERLSAAKNAGSTLATEATFPRRAIGRGWKGALARWLFSRRCSPCSAPPAWRRSHFPPRQGALGAGGDALGGGSGRA